MLFCQIIALNLKALRDSRIPITEDPDCRNAKNLNGDCQRLAAARTFFQVAPPPIPLAYRITHITETLAGE